MKILESRNPKYFFGMIGKASDISKYLKENKHIYKRNNTYLKETKKNAD